MGKWHIVVGACLVAATIAGATPAPAKTILWPNADGKLERITPSRNWDECMTNSRRQKYTEARSRTSTRKAR